MRDEYSKEDEFQMMYSVEYLERLKQLENTKNDDLDLYCQQFKAISKELIAKSQFDEKNQCCWFL